MDHESDEEVTYHDSMLSFNDGLEFFEEVLGGLRDRIDELSEGLSEKSESDYESSSSEESECGCNAESEAEESPFFGADEAPDESDDQKQPNIEFNESDIFDSFDEKAVLDSDSSTEESPFIRETGETEETDEESSFITKPNSDTPIDDIQQIIGGMLRGF